MDMMGCSLFLLKNTTAIHHSDDGLLILHSASMKEVDDSEEPVEFELLCCRSVQF